MQPLYRSPFLPDKLEGLIVVDVETLSDGVPDNNFLKRAATFNPDGVLNGALNITIAGNYAYVTCDLGLVIVGIDDPLHPKVVAKVGAPALRNPLTTAVQFRYAFVIDAEGLKVVDVTFPERPTPVLGAVVPLSDAHDVYVARGYG